TESRNFIYSPVRSLDVPGVVPCDSFHIPLGASNPGLSRWLRSRPSNLQRGGQRLFLPFPVRIGEAREKFARRFLAQLLDRLGDGRKIEQVRHVVTVEADEGQVNADSESVAAQGPHG